MSEARLTIDPATGAELPDLPRREPFFNLPRVVLVLLGIMGAMHAWLSVSSPAVQRNAVETFAFIPVRYVSIDWGNLAALPSLAWPFITHLFLHGNIAHIGFNALWLMAVGTPLARRL